MEYTYQLNTGCMPSTDFRYEEFETFLASFYLTFLHLKDSKYEKSREMFRIINDELNRLAILQKVQIPEDTLENIRTKDERFQPRKFKDFWSVKDSFRAFVSDFRLVDERGIEYDDPATPAMHLHLILCANEAIEKYYFHE